MSPITAHANTANDTNAKNPPLTNLQSRPSGLLVASCSVADTRNTWRTVLRVHGCLGYDRRERLAGDVE